MHASGTHLRTRRRGAPLGSPPARARAHAADLATVLRALGQQTWLPLPVLAADATTWRVKPVSQGLNGGYWEGGNPPAEDPAGASSSGQGGWQPTSSAAAAAMNSACGPASACTLAWLAFPGAGCHKCAHWLCPRVPRQRPRREGLEEPCVCPLLARGHRQCQAAARRRQAQQLL
jgi:hypothetical protein